MCIRDRYGFGLSVVQISSPSWLPYSYFRKSWLLPLLTCLLRCGLGAVDDYSGYAGSKFFDLNGEVYVIQAIVHTHPANGGSLQLSDTDLRRAADFGVPIYNIAPGGISKGYTNSSQSVVDNNRDDAFNCNMTYGLFNL